LESKAHVYNNSQRMLQQVMKGKFMNSKARLRKIDGVRVALGAEARAAAEPHAATAACGSGNSSSKSQQASRQTSQQKQPANDK